MDDDGFGPAGWRGVAFALALIAIVCWIVFALSVGDDAKDPSAPWFWMAVAVSSTVFSAACAVLSAVKTLEERLRSQESA